jgi:diguanylate cyclase (GGDEF)-like protein/PAS domain S-box-containing protein
MGYRRVGKDGGIVAGDGSGARPVPPGPDVSGELDRVASRVAADSDVLLRSLLDNITGTVYVRDAAEGRYLLVNRAFERELGISAEDIVGRTPGEVFPAEIAEDFRVNDLAVLAAAASQTTEVLVPHADGTVHRFVSQKFPMFGPGGRPYAVAGISTDITELVLARRALAESEDRYQALVEGSPIGVVVHADRGILYANRAAARLVGAEDAAALLGREVLSMLPAGEHGRARERSTAFLAGESPKTSRWTMLRDTGEERTVEVTAVGVRFQGEAAIQMEVRDVTEQAEAEAAVLASEARFRTVFTSSPLPMAVSDPDGVLVAVNAALCTMLGTGHAELLGGRLDDLVEPDGCEASPETGELRFRHRSGDVVWGLPTATPLSFGDAPGAGGRTHTLTQIENVTARKTAEALLRHQAEHDSLTGLPNRGTMSRWLTAISSEDLATTAVFFVDLDGFKLLNDSRGHAAGDAVLVEVGARLRAAVRPADLVSRFGGDEFVVVCRDLPGEAERAAIAGRIETALAIPITHEGEIVAVTASVGVAHGHAGMADATDLLHRADAAMYSAKRLGKDRTEVYDDDLHAAAQSRARTETVLRHALDEDRVAVHYQPIIDLGSGEIVGTEALVRLVDLDGKLVPPDQFIAVAEESGLIVPLGTFVLREACRQTAAWRAQTGRALSIAVNLSPRQAARSDLLVTVLSALEGAGLDHCGLFLELTESALLEVNDATLTQLTSLRDLGVGIGIDDFGTGYSSLSYLRQFPVTFLKVDRSFVRGVPAVADDTAVVAAVIGLAGALGLDCVAEGIETDEQLATLRSLDATLGQGFLFSRPVPACELEALLSAGAPVVPPAATGP